MAHIQVDGGSSEVKPDSANDTFVSAELDLVSELFHRINRIVPADQNLVSIAPDTLARDAVSLMKHYSFSQLPVISKGEVLGVFSFRSFATKAAAAELKDINQQKSAPGDWTAEECLERFEYARVTEEMRQVFDAMDRDNGILIGSPEDLQGILTPMDFLRYLYDIASPFVLLSEIELTLRALIKLAVTEEELGKCAEASLTGLYGEGKVPRSVDAMTFDNYRAIISDNRNWPKFEPLFGGSRARVSAKLKQLAELRNDVFHFKRALSVEDCEILSEHRSWLLVKAKRAYHRDGSGK